MSQFIFCIIGPSGVGKTTLAEALQEKYGLKTIESYTDRLPRFEGETGHIFLTPDEFDALTDVVAETVFAGNRFCATAELIDSHDLYVVDVDGFHSFIQRYKGDKIPVVLYLKAQPTTCMDRMLQQGRSFSAAASRIEHDKKAFVEAEGIADIVLDASLSKEELLEQAYEFIMSLSI